MSLNAGKSSLIGALLALAGCASVNPWTGETGAPAENEVATPAMKAEDILGKPATAVDDLLGAPALVRREGPGEYRRYAYEGCALIVILYPDDSGETTASLLDAAAVKSGEEKPDLETCLASVR
ncbi:MAG: hypothetical protein ACE5FO_00755 [Parvularculaceae bacterium]